MLMDTGLGEMCPAANAQRWRTIMDMSASENNKQVQEPTGAMTNGDAIGRRDSNAVNWGDMGALRVWVTDRRRGRDRQKQRDH